MKIEINNDVFYITERLKEIDFNYYIVFNLKSRKFEVHLRGQQPETYCLTVPYDELDERTLFFTKKTQSEKVEKLIKEIEKENEKILKNQKNEILKNIDI